MRQMLKKKINKFQSKVKKEAVTTSPSLLVTLLDKDSVIKKNGSETCVCFTEKGVAN